MSLRILDLAELRFQEGQQPEILLESYSDAVRTIQLRGFTKWGTFSFDHQTLSTRGLKSESFRIPGIPVGLTATTPSVSISRGRMYARIKLRLAGFPVYDLAAAYITDSKEVSWPPGVFESSVEGQGFIRTITGTNPAVNTEITEAVPTGARWRLRHTRSELVTSTQAANRTSTILLDNGTDFTYRTIPAPAQSASLTRGVLGSIGFPFNDTAFDANGYTRTFLPDNILKAGDRWRTITGGLQNLDDFSAPIFNVEEWIDP